jgi:protein-S-isoprenylcysteine O-methyltransferase Ste14
MSLSTVWAWLIYGWAAGEILLALFVRARTGVHNIRDRGTQFILWGVIFGSIFALDWVGPHFPREIAAGHRLKLLAVVVMMCGLAVRIVAIVTLGRSFTVNVATHPSQTLQRSGLYRIVRHPSYLGLEICFLAVGLHTGNWACLALMLIAPTLAVLYRIHVEEQALLGVFGDEYAEYRRTTKRLIPGVY